ncbi:MAG: Crp/Fnr family transcriptional regulator [Spirochaeta sp. LUC14_002_19_P3]|nr:MAG: Crp/Fnr family transcriptional regulator [Spirochaeta sp. LUC14_002_19_P3]
MSLDLSRFERFAKNFSTGQTIFCEYEPGNSFYLINSGRVKIVKIIGAIEKTIDILQPGEFFGEMALLENAPRSASIIAIEDCTILEFNRDNFEALMTGNPQLALNLLHLFAKRINDQIRRFSTLTLKDDYAKVADIFVMLNEQSPFKESNNNKGEREFNCTVEDIAHWAGISVKRSREIISNFQYKNRLTLMQTSMIVTNIHDLERMVKSQRNSQLKEK